MTDGSKVRVCGHQCCFAEGDGELDAKKGGRDWEVESRRTILPAQDFSHRENRDQKRLNNDKLVNVLPLVSFRAIACYPSPPLKTKKY